MAEKKLVYRQCSPDHHINSEAKYDKIASHVQHQQHTEEAKEDMGRSQNWHDGHMLSNRSCPETGKRTHAERSIKSWASLSKAPFGAIPCKRSTPFRTMTAMMVSTTLSCVA
mmetsp:Transcript_57153/g.125547  ORF Transcript_57153/g.125547 Transcript_57153/m.125547 type:complete len:112 (+) Transcript_57153:3-338(+)